MSRFVGAGSRTLLGSQKAASAAVIATLSEWMEHLDKICHEPITEVCSGVSHERRIGGFVDIAFMEWAESRGIPFQPFPYPTFSEMVARGVDVRTARNPRAGGPVRNGWQMIWAKEKPKPIFGIVWNGFSTGSANMKKWAQMCEGGLLLEKVIAR
jgi:hypothetical protein